jgi:hypothetical protein
MVARASHTDATVCRELASKQALGEGRRIAES